MLIKFSLPSFSSAVLSKVVVKKEPETYTGPEATYLEEIGKAAVEKEFEYVRRKISEYLDNFPE